MKNYCNASFLLSSRICFAMILLKLNFKLQLVIVHHECCSWKAKYSFIIHILHTTIYIQLTIQYLVLYNTSDYFHCYLMPKLAIAIFTFLTDIHSLRFGTDYIVFCAFVNTLIDMEQTLQLLNAEHDMKYTTGILTFFCNTFDCKSQLHYCSLSLCF